MSVTTKEMIRHWEAIRPLLSIHNEQDYDRAVKELNRLLDEVGTDESHPLYELMDTLGVMMRIHEEEHHAMPACSGAEMLRYLMEEHGLTQSDLPEVGSQGVISEILSGKRELNLRQIQALVKRFGVSPAVFL
jgi:HTH-type transcriptional regulator/antitoxin HigA